MSDAGALPILNADRSHHTRGLLPVEASRGSNGRVWLGQSETAAARALMGRRTLLIGGLRI